MQLPSQREQVQNKRIQVVSEESTSWCVFLHFDFDFWCFKATFSNISAISCRPVLVVEEAGVPGENHRPWASNW
jgi:hypothetical protein